MYAKKQVSLLYIGQHTPADFMKRVFIFPKPL